MSVRESVSVRVSVRVSVFAVPHSYSCPPPPPHGIVPVVLHYERKHCILMKKESRAIIHPLQEKGA